MKDRKNVDLHKRKTLATITGLTAASAFATFPPLAMSATRHASPTTSTSASVVPADIDARLVSTSGSDQESLLMQNLTDHDITIDRFHANQLIFDGDLIDCNDACAGDSITISARNTRLIQFRRQTMNHTNTPGWQYLDVNADVTRLPEGTRVVPFEVRMSGNDAMLTRKAQALLA